MMQKYKDLIVANGLVVAMGVLALVPSDSAFLLAARLSLALIVVLFIPGYILTGVLFPRDGDIDDILRLVLSFGLSIACVPTLALIINFTAQSINLQSIIFSLIVFTLLSSLVNVNQRRAMSSDEIHVISLPLHPRDWRAGSTVVQSLGLFVAFALIAVAFSLFFVISRQTTPYTEFYLVGDMGQAAGYPSVVVANQPFTLHPIISNQEGSTVTYTIQVKEGSNVITTVTPIKVDAQQQWQGQLNVALPTIQEGQQLDILLYKIGADVAYRQLRLVLNLPTPAPLPAVTTTPPGGG